MDKSVQNKIIVEVIFFKLILACYFEDVCCLTFWKGTGIPAETWYPSPICSGPTTPIYICSHSNGVCSAEAKYQPGHYRKESFICRNRGTIGGWWTITREFRWKLLWDCEPESLSSSGEEDAEMLEMVLERVYTCSRGMFSSKAYAARDPAERSSLLLLDNELLTVEGIRQLSLVSPSSPSVSLLIPLLALNPGFLFWILFHSFWQNSKGKPGIFHI